MTPHVKVDFLIFSNGIQLRIRCPSGLLPSGRRRETEPEERSDTEISPDKDVQEPEPKLDLEMEPESDLEMEPESDMEFETEPCQTPDLSRSRPRWRCLRVRNRTVTVRG